MNLPNETSPMIGPALGRARLGARAGKRLPLGLIVKRFIASLSALTLLAGGLVALVVDAAPASADAITVPVIGPPVLNSAQLAAWFRSTGRTLNVPGENIDALASYFVDEGVAENLRGDIAFVQSIVETGYFGFVGSMVKPTDYNFAGMGACDTCNSGRPFPNARTGVRAQVQHLKNYADINSRASGLRNAPVVEWYGRRTVNGVYTYDPALAIYNFDTFFAKGRAATWNQMGNGNWASSTIYASTIISLYQRVLVWNGIPALAAAGADPAGRTDLVERVPGGVHVGGWSFDVSTPDAISVRVTLNDIPIGTILANGYRPDVAAVFNFGSNHGFDGVLPVTTGGNVCVYGVNVGTGSRDTPLGCGVIPGPDPVGALDLIRRAPGGVLIRGWGLDPDLATAATILVTRDGALAAAIPADVARPDIGAAYPPYGANHGFDAVAPVAGGNLCIFVVNVGPGSAPRLLGCSTLIGGTPIGNVESVSRVPGGVRVTGWALDPDSTSPVSIHVYAGGIGAAISANISRPGLSNYFPGYGDVHGFDAVVPLQGGEVCLYAINIADGVTNPRLGACSTVLGGTPLGSFEAASRVAGGVRLSGWALDGDTAGAVTLHVYANGQLVSAIDANTARTDVGTVFPAWGASHGFDWIIPVTTTGATTYCVYAINVGGGVNPLVGCRVVSVLTQPFGNIESVSRTAGGIRIVGWVIDPDSANAVTVHIYVDGVFRSAAIANLSRPDVGAVFASYGALHGLDATISGGGSQVCVYAIDIGGGVNPLLGCRNI